MSVQDVVITRRDERGRTLELPPALRANLWQKGQTPNPGGRGGLYQEALQLSRKKSVAAMERMIQLAELNEIEPNGKLSPLSKNADPRVAAMCAQWVYERAWGKVKDYDPAKDEAQPLEFDPAKLNGKQLAAVKKAMMVLLAASVPDEQSTLQAEQPP